MTISTLEKTSNLFDGLSAEEVIRQEERIVDEFVAELDGTMPRVLAEETIHYMGIRAITS